MTTQAQLVFDGKATLGEGPIWDVQRQRLWWIDIDECLLHKFNPADGSNQTYPLSSMIGTVVPRQSGGLMLALESGFASYDPDTNKLDLIHDPEPDIAENRFNDGKCDPQGRFWAGTISKSEKAQASAQMQRLFAVTTLENLPSSALVR